MAFYFAKIVELIEFQFRVLVQLQNHQTLAESLNLLSAAQAIPEYQDELVAPLEALQTMALHHLDAYSHVPNSRGVTLAFWPKKMPKMAILRDRLKDFEKK